MRIRRLTAIGVVLAMVGATAQADPVTGKAARTMLYPTKIVEVEILPQSFLTDSDIAVIKQVAVQQIYYAAIAMSPDEGLASEATVAGANFHDTGAASVFALAGCEATRAGASPCVIVALVRPKGWEPRALHLSRDATDIARTDYQSAKAPKAFATSAATGLWAMAVGEGAGAAALAACAAKGEEVTDCALVLAD